MSGTTRHAERYQLQELILEGQNRYYDCEPVDGLIVTEEDIARLCADMKAMAIRNTIAEVEKAKVRDFTKNILLSWGVLAEKDGTIVPTNAYALLTGKAQPVVQCGIFKGKDRAYFVDRREFHGSVQDQMEAAFQYVLEKINRGMIIQGVQRQDVYELPEPEFIDFDGDFRVNMYRKTGTGAVNGANGTILDTNDTNQSGEAKMLELIRRTPGITQNQIKVQTGLSLRTVKRMMAELQSSGRISRIGNNRSGKWQVNE